MSFLDTFNRLQNELPEQPESSDNMINGYQQYPSIPNTNALANPYNDGMSVGPVWEWEREFNQTRLNIPPTGNTLGSYISPYASNNWGGSSLIINDMETLFQAPPFSNKVDPNKIFNSDIAALRALAADQAKIVKMFEAKLKEGLNERGKTGLNEVDIEGMQALTAARNAITSINKEQIGIKKNIADLRIKQQQLSNQSSGGKQTDTNVNPTSPFGVGRSMLDNIFESAISSQNNNDNINYSASEMSLADVNNMIDNLVENVDTHTKYEHLNPTTYVVVGDRDEDAEFVTYSSTGEIIPDYPNPDTKITKIDRDSGNATDERLQNYPLKQK